MSRWKKRGGRLRGEAHLYVAAVVLGSDGFELVEEAQARHGVPAHRGHTAMQAQKQRRFANAEGFCKSRGVLQKQRVFATSARAKYVIWRNRPADKPLYSLSGPCQRRVRARDGALRARQLHEITRLGLENFDEGIKHAGVVLGAAADAAHLQTRLDDIGGVDDAGGTAAG